MHLRALAVAVALLVGAMTGAEQCGDGAGGGGERLLLWMSSEVNTTGHWAAELRLQRSGPAGRAARRLELQAEPSSWRSADGFATHALQLSLRGPPPPPPPPSDYEALPPWGFYKLHEAATAWEEAEVKCLAEGAHLLVLNSDGEADAVKQLIARHPKATAYLHVGFHSKDAPARYVTIFGQSLADSGYARWSSGEPSLADIERCGSISKAVLLNDIKCTEDTRSFICEYSP